MPDSEPSPEYRYGKRVVEPMPERAFRFGEGRIAGFVSLALGAMAFLAVLCFLFPELLTTQELREVYDVDVLRTVIRVAMWTSLALGVFNFVRSRGTRWMGALGVGLTLVAYFIGGSLPGRAVQQVGPGVGVDWMVLDLLKSTVIFIFLEKLFPKYKEQAILRPEWQLDLGYFAMNHLLIGVLLMVANGFAPTVFGWAVNERVQSFVSGIWLPAQALLLMFCADFVQYWVHRAYHEIPWLWGLHAVHHSAEHLDWLAGSRTHLVQTLIDRALVMVPLYLLGPRVEALNLYVVIVAFQAVLIHSNINWRFGPLGYLFVTPKFHHWHHSKDRPAIDTNYAAHLPVLDLLFGTFHMPKKHWPKEYGTVKRLPRTFIGQFIYPFRGEGKPDAVEKRLATGASGSRHEPACARRSSRDQTGDCESSNIRAIPRDGRVGSDRSDAYQRERYSNDRGRNRCWLAVASPPSWIARPERSSRRTIAGGTPSPRPDLYPFQRIWDSAFVALGLATFYRVRAWEELRTLVSSQWDDGMIPHIVFHRDGSGFFPGPDEWGTANQPRTSGITQPPVLASVVHRLWRTQGSDPADPDLAWFYPRVLAWHRWFHWFRDPLGKGLVVATHPWETGRDNSAEWDTALAGVDATDVVSSTEFDRYVALIRWGRGVGWDADHIVNQGPFRVADVGMTMMLLRADRDLLAMAHALGDGPVVEELRERITLAESGVDWLWHEDIGAFCSRNAITGASSGLFTSASLLAFDAGAGTPRQRQRMVEGLERVDGRVQHLVPSLDPETSTYDPIRGWRGPVWLVVNYLVARGLAAAGYRAWSERIRADSAHLVQKSGFYEAFSPDDGTGTGPANFSRTAAMWLAWCGAA